ncbi:uncharacterized protein LOC141599559 [Silene latifolia]|uniref:uncharacterized protein LOC141599559 n=1 Tax=Silene latifolia TaxID=37657 RepID=UPI003D7755D7
MRAMPHLKSNLEGKTNQANTRKLINKMASDGFLQASNSRCGMRVLCETQLNQNGSLRGGRSIDKTGEHEHPNTSHDQWLPASRESMVHACGQRANHANTSSARNLTGLKRRMELYCFGEALYLMLIQWNT